MIEEQAQLVRIDKHQQQYAWVKTQRQSSCGSCEGKSACGTQVLSKFLGQRSNIVKVLNPSDAQEGDWVVIGIDEKALLSGSFYLYFLPLFVMIIFSLFATLLTHGLNLNSVLIDVSAIIFAIIGFVSGVWLSRRKLKTDLNTTHSQYQAIIIRVLNVKNIVTHF
jgi:sigma-E factor negative regulatory protein RseC